MSSITRRSTCCSSGSRPPRRPAPRGIAPSGSPTARAAASLRPEELSAPAPRLLAAPVKGKAATGFTRLFAGDGEIIGEVVDSGVAVRAELGYRELGIEAPVDPKSDFGTATMTDLQFLSCGNRAFPKLQAVGTAMRERRQAGRGVNGAIAAGSPWRVEQVFVVNEASRLHFADGQALMVLSHKDFDSNGPETAAHEASHAVFESHSHPDRSSPRPSAPDAFALRLADLFLRLAKTPSVSASERAVQEAAAAAEAGGDGPQQPAGLRDGHRQPVERRRDHRGASVGRPRRVLRQRPRRLRPRSEAARRMIAHYAPLDASSRARGRAASLLTAAEGPRVKALQRPRRPAEGATEAIRQRESQPSTIKERLGAILSPETLPPETVTCPAK